MRNRVEPGGRVERHHFVRVLPYRPVASLPERAMEGPERACDRGQERGGGLGRDHGPAVVSWLAQGREALTHGKLAGDRSRREPPAGCPGNDSLPRINKVRLGQR